MQQHGADYLVVVTEFRIPVGMIADRDLMERIVAASRDAAETKVLESRGIIAPTMSWFPTKCGPSISC